MAFNQIPVACTSENAPFQQFDLWWIDQFVSRGVDMPCGMMGAILNFTICGSILIVAAIILGIWHYRTRDQRDPLGAMARRDARRKVERHRAARVRVLTARREELARQLRWAREDAAMFPRRAIKGKYFTWT